MKLVRGNGTNSLLTESESESELTEVDNAIHWINRCPVDNAIGFPNTYSLDSEFSGGQCYPTLEPTGA